MTGLNGYVLLVGHPGPRTITLPLATSSDTATERCANGTIETNTTGWDSNTLLGGLTSCTWEQSSVQAHGGTYSIRANWPDLTGTGTTGSCLGIWATTGDVPGLYRVGAWIYVPSGSPDVWLDVAFKATSPPITVKDTWVYREVTWYGTDGYVNLGLVNGKYTNQNLLGTYGYIDDVSIHRVDQMAHPVARLRTYSLAQAAETDTAFAITYPRVKAITQATETDIAHGVTAVGQHVITVPVANETDTTHAVTKVRALAQPSSAHTAFALTQYRTYALAQPSSAETAQGVRRVKTLAQAVETDTAWVLVRPMVVATYNVLNSTPNQDTYDDLMYLISQGAVLLALQEVGGTKNTALNDVAAATGYSVDYSINTTSQDAIMWDPDVLVSEAQGDYQINVSTEVYNPTVTIGVRYVTWRRFHPAESTVNDLTFTFGVIHYVSRPNMDQSRSDLMIIQAAATADWATSLSRVLLGGDFNEDYNDYRWELANGLRSTDWINNHDLFGELITFPDPALVDDRSFDQIWFRPGMRIRPVSHTTYDGSSDHHALLVTFELLDAPYSVPITQATHAAIAQAVTRLRTYSLTQPSSGETAQPISRIYSLALATETDTAQTVASGSAYPLALASEADTAPALTSIRTYVLALASETDTAWIFWKITQTAFPLTRLRTYQIAQAPPGAGIWRRNRYPAQSVEADTAHSIEVV